MEVLYVSQYFPPEPGAPAARVHELARAWVTSGIKVSVLTAFPNHPTGVVPPEYRGSLYRQETVDGIRVHRTYIYPAANAGVWGRALNYISFALSALVTGVLKAKAPDVVVATSPQFLVALAGYLVAGIRRVPFVFEVRDLWPASIVAVGALRAGSWPVRLLETLERFLYRRAQHIVVVTDAFKEIIAASGIPDAKISVVKNGVDLKQFRPGPKPRELLARHGMEGKFVAAYIGTIGMAHGIGRILDAARRLQPVPEVQFIVVGEGAERAALSAAAAAEGLANVKFIGAVPRSEVRNWILASDVCLVPLRNRQLFRTVIPSKMFEILACARPVLLSVAGESADLLRQANAGLVVDPENTDQLCQAIMFLKEQPDLAQAMGARGRSFVKDHFDRGRQAIEYGNLLMAILLETARPERRFFWNRTHSELGRARANTDRQWRFRVHPRSSASK